ncbi:MAG: hypothetical protein DI534_11225 [Leifsonia xyli]|nr:MAG: hypothetical protein DI534_11225 [Leifsonia xyli]
MTVRFAALAVVFLAAGVMLFWQDRSAAMADRLVRDGQVRPLDPTETTALSGFVTTLLKVEGADVEVAINQPYRSGRLNIYVVDSDKSPNSGVPKGNAAYISSSDIILVDGMYFQFGSRRVLAVAENSLDEKVLAPLRVYAYFILAHELGHRQLHRGWFNAFRALGGQSRETEADAFAVGALRKLYSTEEMRRSAHIPETVSELSGFFGEVTPLQRIVDHLSLAVSFLADDIFDSPFPLLSQTRSHPAFLGRLDSLLKGLGEAAAAAKDEDAIRQMSVATSVLESTRRLLEFSPSEVEFNDRFQYAYIDRTTLFVVGADGRPVTAIALSELDPGRQYWRTVPAFQGEPSVRYAWAGPSGQTMALRRDGRLATVKSASGDVVGGRSLQGQLGDNSCARQLVLPPQPSDYVFASYCEAGSLGVARIGQDGSFVRRSLKDLIGEARAPGVDLAEVTPRSFDLDAGGRPTVVFSLGQENYRLSLSRDLTPQAPIRLALADERLWAEVRAGPARLFAKATIADPAGKTFYLTGSPIFRNFEMRSAETAEAELLASTGPSFRAGRLASETLRIALSYSIGENRLIVSLVEGGAFLIDFGRKRLDPIRRRGFDPGEQIVANEAGDWIYYRKYDRRLLLFRGTRNGEAN